MHLKKQLGKFVAQNVRVWFVRKGNEIQQVLLETLSELQWLHAGHRPDSPSLPPLDPTVVDPTRNVWVGHSPLPQRVKSFPSISIYDLIHILFDNVLYLKSPNENLYYISVFQLIALN